MLIGNLPTVSPGDTAAVCLAGVFGYRFGVEWRQLAMQIHDGWLALVIRGVHMAPWVEERDETAYKSVASSSDITLAIC
jgi:hypothetical protein